MNVPGVYQNADLETPAVNRDPAFIRDPASNRSFTVFTYLLTYTYTIVIVACLAAWTTRTARTHGE